MPKISGRDLNDEWYACAQCGETTNLSLREHHRQVHQLECTLLYQGESERVTVYRDSDGLWRCPRCATEFAGCTRRIQDHARSGKCEGERPEDVGMDDNAEESDSSLPNHKGEEEDEDEEERGDENNAENRDMDIAAAVKATGLSQSELADLVAWTKQKSARASRRASVPEAIMALEAVTSPKIAKRSSDFESDMPSHPPDWLATRHPPRARDHSKAISGPKPIQKAKPYQRHTAKLPAAPIQAVVLQDAFAKTRRPTSLNELQSPLEPEASTSRKSSTLTEASQPSQPAPTVRGGERIAALNAQPASTTAFTTRTSASSAAVPPLPPRKYARTGEDSAIPPALKAFFGTVRVPLEHLAPIFVNNGLDTVEALDMLCTMSVGELEDLKSEVIAEGRLVGWLAIRKALTERAQSLGV